MAPSSSARDWPVPAREGTHVHCKGSGQAQSPARTSCSEALAGLRVVGPGKSGITERVLLNVCQLVRDASLSPSLGPCMRTSDGQQPPKPGTCSWETLRSPPCSHPAPSPLRAESREGGGSGFQSKKHPAPGGLAPLVSDAPAGERREEAGRALCSEDEKSADTPAPHCAASLARLRRDGSHLNLDRPTSAGLPAPEPPDTVIPLSPQPPARRAHVQAWRQAHAGQGRQAAPPGNVETAPGTDRLLAPGWPSQHGPRMGRTASAARPCSPRGGSRGYLDPPAPLSPAWLSAPPRGCSPAREPSGWGRAPAKGNQTGTHCSKRGFSERAELPPSPPALVSRWAVLGALGAGGAVVREERQRAWAAGHSTPCSSAGGEGRASWGQPGGHAAQTQPRPWAQAAGGRAAGFPPLPAVPPPRGHGEDCFPALRMDRRLQDTL